MANSRCAVPGLLSLAGPAHADDQQGQRDCANLRAAVLQLVGDWPKNMLFAIRDMDLDGWLDANVAHSAFKDVQMAVMHFDYAYDAVPRTPDTCHRLFSSSAWTWVPRSNTSWPEAPDQQGVQRAP